VPGSRDFSFIVYKTSSELRIAIYDPSLFQMVAFVTGKSATPNNVGDAVIFDGFAVLAKYAKLKQHLDSCFSTNQEPPDGALALNLLVGEFLTDAEVFRKFGFESLHERGYLPFELWNTFQSRQLADDVTLLDDSFNAYDDEVSRHHLDQDAHPESEPAPWMTLRQAAGCGNEYIVQLLLNQGVYVDQDAGDGITPLVVAALGNHDSTVRLLLNRGAKVDGDGLRFTALGKAVEAGHKSTVRLLLSRGASVDGIGVGLTPMTEAAARGCKSMVSLLLDWGAAVEGKPRGDPGQHSTPLEAAAAGGYDSTVRLLLDRGATSSHAAWKEAAEKGHESTARLLCDLSTFPSSVVSFMLKAAVVDGNEPMVRLLLNQGASAEHVYFSSSSSPLAEVAAGGNEALVRPLPARGAEIESSQAYAYTALDLAVTLGYEPIARLLRDRGAKNWSVSDMLHRDEVSPMTAPWVPGPLTLHKGRSLDSKRRENLAGVFS
jgi:ankyrin repeat protein